MKNVRLTVALIVYCFYAGVCLAQEGEKTRYAGAVIGAFGGMGADSQKTAPGLTGGTWAAGTHSFAYSIGYRQQFHRMLSGSFTYLNQGHYDRHGYRTDHHSRDDVQVEVFLGKRPLDGPVEFRIGGGPAYSSETDKTDDGPGFQNRQGFGLVVTGAVDVDITNRLFVEVGVHRQLVLDRYDATNVLLGTGWRFQAADNPPRGGTEDPKHSIRINYGMGKLNSTESETLRDSFQVGYEISLSKHFGGAVSYLREGNARELDRKGLAIQGIAKQEVAGRVTLGFGLGPYANVDQSDFFQRQGKFSVDALFTAFLDLRVSKNLELSLSSSRPRSLTTLQNKPMTDLYHTGLKFRFR